MRADVNAIKAGYHGRLDMFEAIGWIERQTGEQTAARQMTEKLFDALHG